MEIPEYYHVWKNKPGRLNSVLRWIGYKIEYWPIYISLLGLKIVRKGQWEQKIEIDLSRFHPDYSVTWTEEDMEALKEL